MGQEAYCSVRFEGRVSEGKALLETNDLRFRGDFRLTIPFREMKSLESKEGQLCVAFSGGAAVFELGPLADEWAFKIRNPKGLLEKLGIKPGARLTILGVNDAAFLADIEKIAGELSNGLLLADSDFVFVEADHPDDLGKLQEIPRSIKKNGAIWVVSPKGKSARIREVDVIEAAKAAGLVDTKVVAFSETHTALKLVIPLAKR